MLVQAITQCSMFLTFHFKVILVEDINKHASHTMLHEFEKYSYMKTDLIINIKV
jgi:hypothetical protein